MRTDVSWRRNKKHEYFLFAAFNFWIDFFVRPDTRIYHIFREIPNSNLTVGEMIVG